MAKLVLKQRVKAHGPLVSVIRFFCFQKLSTLVWNFHEVSLAQESMYVKVTNDLSEETAKRT